MTPQQQRELELMWQQVLKARHKTDREKYCYLEGIRATLRILGMRLESTDEGWKVLDA